MSGHAPRVAIVHDWLVTFAGAEQVLKEMLAVYPSADLFSCIDFLSASDRERLQGKHAETTFIQRLPGARRLYRHYLPLMPLAIEQLDLSSYDLVLSSSHAVAKGVLTGPDQLHVAYVHSPMRYAWDLQHQYLSESGLGWGPVGLAARVQLHRLRAWDLASATRPDVLLANSSFIARRIQKVYRRPATVVHPPVDIEAYELAEGVERSHYVTVSRFVPYKRVDAVIRAFAKMPDKQLVVVGDGPDRAKLERLASSNVRLVGHVPLNALREYLQRARAFVFAAEEDFGIAPVEAQACGTPVLAYGRGGARDSVVSEGVNRTGMFFGEQTPSAICDAVHRFEAQRDLFDPKAIREHALRFSAEAFRANLRRAVDDARERFAPGPR